jgi:hypothetical protein
MKKVKIKNSSIQSYYYRVNLEVNLYMSINAADHEQAEDKIAQMSLEELLKKTITQDHHLQNCYHISD